MSGNAHDAVARRVVTNDDDRRAALTAARSRAVRGPCRFDDELDLDAGAERKLGDAEGAARMRALFGEDLAEQLRAAVGDEMVLGEVGRAVDEAGDANDPLDLVEIADGGVQGAEQIDGDGARCLLAGGS